jgi:hypothetical protein
LRYARLAFATAPCFQIQVSKRVDAVPMTRDYIPAREHDIARHADTPQMSG